MTYTRQIYTTVTFLAFAVFIGIAKSECNITNDAGVVYMQYNLNTSVLLPLQQPPNITTDVDTCQEHPDEGCCSCDNSFLCKSMDDALMKFQTIKENKTLSLLILLIGNNYSFETNFPLNRSHSINGLSSLVLQGYGMATLTCSTNGSLEFNESCHTVIQNISFSHCGTHLKGALVLNNQKYINISGITIEESVTSGLVLMQRQSYDVCDFITDSQYVITGSIFYNNGGKTVNGKQQLAMYGGGLTLNIGSTTPTTINNSKFISNIAEIGGGVSFITTNGICKATLKINSCDFILNNATIHGGAMYFSSISTTIENTRFTNNSAIYTGGAIYQFIVPLTIVDELCSISTKIVYDNCTWEGNSAEGSGALLIVTASILSPNMGDRIITIMNNTFQGNIAKSIRFFGRTTCIINSQNIPIELIDTHIIDNQATSVCIESAKMTLAGSIGFYRNNGLLGGAVYTERSVLGIEAGSNITFVNNTGIYGGAIYRNGQSQELNCLFDFEYQSSGSNLANVSFINNRAVSSGNSIYFYEPNITCQYEIEMPEISFFPNLSTIQQVSSDATALYFHEPVTFENGTNRLELILGQNIILNVSVYDFFNSSSFAEINIYLLSPNGEEFDIDYDLQGFRHISIETGINTPDLYIKGLPITDKPVEDYTLGIIGFKLEKKIVLTLNPCPIGFNYNQEQRQCECIADDEIVCDNTTALACIQNGYWLGTVQGSSAIAPCASLYCQNTNNNCTLCPIVDKETQCLLPAVESEQCIENRHGFICTECEEGYAFTFSAIKCVPDTSCSKGKSVIPAILNVIFLVLIVVWLIAILKLDYKLSSGYVFSFVYYFSIVGRLVNATVVGNTVLLIVAIFESITQLNPRFLGHISICFSPNLSILEQQALVYLNPLIISIGVLLVIGLSKCFSKFIKFSDNTPVKAICLLLLLSFTALTETSFNIINPVQFDGIPGIFVNIEPSTNYLNISKHLPWFFIAVLTFIFLVFPFTFLLLFAPLLAKFGNLNKIKPFLDEFQGCYKDKFRWMAGYYFVARLLYLLILTSPVYQPVASQYVIQVLSFLILMFHMLLQPYENNWLNFVDSLLLADLVLITLLNGETARVVFASIPELRQTFLYVLLFIPVIYLGVVIIVTVGNRWFDRETFYKVLKKMKNMDEEDTVTYTEVERDRSQSLTNSLREPLLELLDSNEVRSLSLNQYKSPARKSRRRQVSHSVLFSPDSYTGSETDSMPSDSPSSPSDITNEQNL